MNRLFLTLAAFVVALDVFNGAIDPMGLPAWLNVAVALAISYGAVRALRPLALGEPSQSDR